MTSLIWALPLALAADPDEALLQQALDQSAAMIRTRGGLASIQVAQFGKIRVAAAIATDETCTAFGAQVGGLVPVAFGQRVVIALTNPEAEPLYVTAVMSGADGEPQLLVDGQRLGPGETWHSRCLLATGPAEDVLVHAMASESAGEASAYGEGPAVGIGREMGALGAVDALRNGQIGTALLLRIEADAKPLLDLTGELQRALVERYAPGTALLVYTAGEAPSVLAIDRDHIVSEPIAALGEEQVAHAVAASHEPYARVASRGLRAVAVPSAKAKEMALFPGDVRDVVARARHLVVVPAGPIARVPFAALPLGTGAVVDRASVTLAPHVAAVLSPPPAWTGEPFTAPLVIGDPVTEQELGLPALPGARREAGAVANHLGTKPVLGEEATREHVIPRAREADLLYLATHGVADPEAPLSGGFLALTGGRWTALEILLTDFDARLAVLSACSSGRGLAHAGGTIGLSRSFQVAGVPRVVMSLWEVDDEATEALMLAFVGHLDHAAPPEALRLAMLDLRAREPDPAKWGAFSLFGTAR